MLAYDLVDHFPREMVLLFLARPPLCAAFAYQKTLELIVPVTFNTKAHIFLAAFWVWYFGQRDRVSAP